MPTVWQIKKVAGYGVMSLPALVVSWNVKSSGSNSRGTKVKKLIFEATAELKTEQST
jgi:hypothetical protein